MNQFGYSPPYLEEYFEAVSMYNSTYLSFMQGIELTNWFKLLEIKAF
jgi:hypothetical protein